MTVSRKSIGSGLTEQETVVFSQPLSGEEQSLHDQMMKLQVVNGRLEHIQEFCAGILAPVGLPAKSDRFLVDDEGEWRLADGPPLGITYTDRIWPIAERRGYAPDSPVGFAAELLDLVDRLRRQREEGALDGAVMTAFFLGFKWASAGIKGRHAEKSRSAQPARKGNRDVEFAREFLTRRPESYMSDSALKADVGKPLSRSKAIEAVNRGLKILSR